jgi:hypothetical protein
MSLDQQKLNATSYGIVNKTDNAVKTFTHSEHNLHRYLNQKNEPWTSLNVLMDNKIEDKTPPTMG